MALVWSTSFSACVRVQQIFKLKYLVEGQIDEKVVKGRSVKGALASVMK